jgi:hypothetical protein
MFAQVGHGSKDMAADQALDGRLGGFPGLDTKDSLSWGLAVGFVATVTGLLAAGLGQLVQLFFPVAAVLVAAALYFQHPTFYLGFTWWVWFLTPEVRRLVDYQIGWNPNSPVMIAPYLVAGVAVLTLLRCLPRLLRKAELFPFALILTAVNYGYMIGLVRAGPLPATFDLINWMVPIVLGFHIAANWQQYPLYKDAIQRVFLWGTLAMGTYGIVQFYVLPPWDAHWMNAAQMGSVGQPQPFQVRVWSTINSPGPFASVMVAGLLLAVAAKGPVRLVAGATGFVAFLLSLVRSAWFGWAIGAVFLLARVRGIHKIRLLAAGILLLLFSLPLLLLEPVAETVTSRFQTIQQLEEDHSYSSRLALYRDFLLVSATNVVGEGIGTTGVATKLYDHSGPAWFGNFDNGVLEIMFVLGWPGTILLASGVAWLLSLGFAAGIPRGDLPAQAARAIVIASLAQLPFSNPLVGVAALVFWTFLGLLLSARMFCLERESGTLREPKERALYCPAAHG